MAKKSKRSIKLHMPEPRPVLPMSLDAAAVAIRAVAGELCRGSNEPYRVAAYMLGWEHLDGTDWWNDVMDEVG